MWQQAGRWMGEKLHLDGPAHLFIPYPEAWTNPRNAPVFVFGFGCEARSSVRVEPNDMSTAKVWAEEHASDLIEVVRSQWTG